MEQKNIQFNETIQSPKLRRRGADSWYFSSTGNTEDNFKSISKYLGNDELIHLFFYTFDTLIGTFYEDFEVRIDSFTHNLLSIPQLLAIITYLNKIFLNIFTFERNDMMNNLYIDKNTFDYLMETYNSNDQNECIRVARCFLYKE